MAQLALVLALMGCASTCPNPVIDNPTGVWSSRDKDAYDSARTRCKVHFPGSPCLITFYKVAEGRYRAVCGQR